MSIRQLWHRYRRLPRSRRVMIYEASCWLLLARLIVLLVPFPWIARRIGHLHPPETVSPDAARDSGTAVDNEGAARSISWAIDRAAQVLPLRLRCLPRALAAWQMLRNRGIHARLHFGASREADGDSISSHAWVDAWGVEVTGYPEAHNCVEMGFFVHS